MRFVATGLTDACLIEPEAHRDERGYFLRARCAREFREQGLPVEFVQTNLSWNKSDGTFRGLHYQIPPSSESKLVRCVNGAIDDVIVDLRPGSATFLQHEWFHLSAENGRALLVPSGFAHGFLTASDAALILYEMTDYYAPELSRGIRWDDPMLGIQLPGRIRVINQRDKEYENLHVENLEEFRQAGQ